MKYIFLLLLLNSCLFAGNEIIIKTTTSEKISFELYGRDSVHVKVDTAIFKLVIHNYSDKKFFIADPEVAELEPGINYEDHRVFFDYAGIYPNGMSWCRLKVLEPGESLEVPILVKLKKLRPSNQFSSYFVEIMVGYIPYAKRYEYLAKKQFDSPLVNFKNVYDLIDFSGTHKAIELCCMPIYINLKK